MLHTAFVLCDVLKNTVNTIKKQPAEQGWNHFFKEFQSQRGGRFVEVHFGVSFEVLLDYFRGMLGWYGAGWFSLVVWGFRGVILAISKPFWGVFGGVVGYFRGMLGWYGVGFGV